MNDSQRFSDPSMPHSDQGGKTSDDPRLIQIVEAYQQELDVGRVPDRQKFIDRCPELADEIANCLDGLELLRGGFHDRGISPPNGGESESNSNRNLAHPTPANQKPVPGQSGLKDSRELQANPLGDFQIVREIARGGMGIVYEAIQLSLGRRVALKVLPFAATFDNRQLQRFKNEAQAAALLHHAHIVPIYAVGSERGVHFYAMQLIEGQSLAVVIKQLREQFGRKQTPDASSTETWHSNSSEERGRAPAALSDGSGSDRASAREAEAATKVDISATVTAGSKFNSETYIRRAAQLMVQAAEALEHAHQVGVVHRDIKPGNLMVDANGNVWITDFGLAQFQIERGLTRTGDFLGTLRYMSPEQTSGQRTVLDHRTDIYSLGATLYELLTLEPVFAGETYQELLYQILHQEPRGLQSINRAVSPELEIIVLKALRKNPAERYTTAANFAADIRRFLNHEPIKARRPTLWDRARKWSRRHPSVVIATMALLVVVTVSSLVSNRLIGLEQQRTKEALANEKQRANEAQQHFQQARAAVDALFQISEVELAGKPEQGLRRQMLELVLNYYQDFINEKKDDPASQAELTAVQSKVKKVLAQLELIDQDIPTRLLGNSAVQKELNLTPDQISKLQTVWARPAMPGVATPSEVELRNHMAANAEAHERTLASVLTPEQLKRFKELSIQSQGFQAFNDPTIIKTLGLSSEQRARIRDFEREAFVRHFRPPEEMPKGGPPPAGFFGLDHKDAFARALSVLSDDQLKTWRELTGESFSNFDPPRPPGPDPGK